MKREANLLLKKACDSLILTIEFFNRPHDIGRNTPTIILLDHAFEMLLKAAILHRNGRIREKRASETISFAKCIRIGISEGPVKFLNEEQALTLQGINAIRGAAHHHLIDISENQLYIQVQSGITLFRDLFNNIFGGNIHELLPNRVLPISTTAPVNLEIMFDSEIKEVIKLLQPGSRKKLEARAKLRPLVLLDSSIQGKNVQPSPNKLEKIGDELVSGKNWQELFPGVYSIETSATGTGADLAIRWTKKEGIPIHTVPEGTPGAAVVAVKRVNELDYYNLSHTKLAKSIGLTPPKTTALVRYLRIKENEKYYKRIKIDKSEFNRYSQEAIKAIQAVLPEISMEDIWNEYVTKRRKDTNAVETV